MPKDGLVRCVFGNHLKVILSAGSFEHHSIDPAVWLPNIQYTAGSIEWCPIDWNGKNVDLKVKVNTFLSSLSYIRIFPLTAMHKRVICLQISVKFNIPSVSD